MRAAVGVLLVLGPLSPFWGEPLNAALGLRHNVDGSFVYVIVGPALALIGLFVGKALLASKPRKQPQ